jgi:hypothetical protein
VSCTAIYFTSNRKPWQFVWLTYPTGQAADGGGTPAVDYRLTEPAPPAAGPLTAQPALWVDPSGTVFLAGWNFVGRSTHGSRVVTDFGLIRNGKLTSLPIPPGVPSGIANANLTAVAW